MSIESEITRIQENVTDTYSTLSELGADMPETQNTKNLASTATTIKALLYIEQELTDEQKNQVKENLDLNNNINEEVDIATEINNSSTDSQVASALAVANLTHGATVNSELITKYEGDILKFPSGVWRVPYNSVAEQLTNLPVEGKAGIMETYSLTGADGNTPWTKQYIYYMYRFTVYSTGKTYINVAESDSSGEVSIMGWIEVGASNIEYEYISERTMTALPNKIYRFSSLSEGEALNITLSTTNEYDIYHFIFKAGGTAHDITITNSDGYTLKKKGLSEFESGTKYEISCLGDIAIIA